MGIINLTKANIDTETSSGLAVLDFWATWCGPCTMLSPILDEIAEEISDVKFCKVNVDEEMELAQKFHIVSIPTIVFLKDGEFIYQMVGLRDKEEIVKAIEARK
jgi:thioredoxin 1